MPAPFTNTPLPPPPTEAELAGVADNAGVSAPVRLQNPWALLGASMFIAALLAGVIGLAIGAAAMSSSASSCTPTDGWCDLGAALVGLAVGVLAGTITYIAAGVVTISRFRPKGRRARAVMAHLAAPFVLYVGLALLGAIINALVGAVGS